MTKSEYISNVYVALAETFERVMPEFPEVLNNEHEPSDLQLLNDEVMLAVYEATGDKRRP